MCSVKGCADETVNGQLSRLHGVFVPRPSPPIPLLRPRLDRPPCHHRPVCGRGYEPSSSLLHIHCSCKSTGTAACTLTLCDRSWSRDLVQWEELPRTLKQPSGGWPGRHDSDEVPMPHLIRVVLLGMYCPTVLYIRAVIHQLCAGRSQPSHSSHSSRLFPFLVLISYYSSNHSFVVRCGSA